MNTDRELVKASKRNPILSNENVSNLGNSVKNINPIQCDLQKHRYLSFNYAPIPFKATNRLDVTPHKKSISVKNCSHSLPCVTLETKYIVSMAILNTYMHLNSNLLVQKTRRLVHCTCYAQSRVCYAVCVSIYLT